MPHDDVLRALASTWQAWAALGGELDDEAWARPTRCEPWTVKDLYAHHSGFPLALSAPAPPVPPAAPLTSAAEVLRSFNAPGGIAEEMAGAVADHAVAEGAAHPAAELVERFTSVAPAVIAALQEADPATPVPWPGHVVELGEALRIVLLEATVHLLDACRALGRSPTVPDDALRLSAALLAEVAPALELVEAATGRSDTSPFPVLR